MKYIPSIICFAAALTLAVLKIQGWGWFLFFGFLMMEGALSKK